MVELRTGSVVWPVGTPDFLHGFFATIAARLEPDGWGTRFPAVMRTLYGGEIRGEDAARALDELGRIRAELRGRPELGDFSTTVDGRDLFDHLAEALAYAARAPYPLVIE